MANEYGVKESGFVRKRLDKIKESIYEKLKEGWGFDTTINPQSALNVIVTGLADEIATVWEVAEDTYYSMYPTSAEGGNLDNAMQFGGITRKQDARTSYMLSCASMINGLDVAYGVLAKSNTNPEKIFRCANMQTISSNNFRNIVLKLYLDADVALFYVTINDETFTYTKQTGDREVDILNGLYLAIDADGIMKTINTEDMIIMLEDEYKQTSNTISMSNNILIAEVTSNILFESMDYGPILIATGLINEMITGDTGIIRISNDLSPTLGRFKAADIEARQSYIARSALRSKNMLESIEAAIYNSVSNVIVVKGYENDTDENDTDNRPPHSVEIIVDGGDEGEIAQIIYNEKANGVRAFGNITYAIADKWGNLHSIGFSRPTYVYAWLKVEITRKAAMQIAPNYSTLCKKSILDDAENIQVGDSVYLQTFLQGIYEEINGISYVSLKAFKTISMIESPSSYELDNIIVNSREKVIFDEARIEVVLVD